MRKLIRRIRVYFESQRALRFINKSARECRRRSVEWNTDVYLALSRDGRLVCSDRIPEADAKGVGRRKRAKAYKAALDGCLYWRTRKGDEITQGAYDAARKWYVWNWLKSRGL